MCTVRRRRRHCYPGNGEYSEPRSVIKMTPKRPHSQCGFGVHKVSRYGVDRKTERRVRGIMPARVFAGGPGKFTFVKCITSTGDGTPRLDDPITAGGWGHRLPGQTLFREVALWSRETEDGTPVQWRKSLTAIKRRRAKLTSQVSRIPYRVLYTEQ